MSGCVGMSELRPSRRAGMILVRAAGIGRGAPSSRTRGRADDGGGQRQAKEGAGMRILVTGGTGHLGRDIVGLLKDQGHQVRVLARTPGQDPGVEWIQGDLATGRGITEAVSGTEVIV